MAEENWSYGVCVCSHDGTDHEDVGECQLCGCAEYVDRHY